MMASNFKRTIRPTGRAALPSMDLAEHFEIGGASPYMLQFAAVRSPKLAAIAHVDGTARPQSVSRNQNALLYDLLVAFRALSGYGVLCNTSLNFKGCGFINGTRDLVRFAREADLEGVVIEGLLFLRSPAMAVGSHV